MYRNLGGEGVYLASGRIFRSHKRQGLAGLPPYMRGLKSNTYRGWALLCWRPRLRGHPRPFRVGALIMAENTKYASPGITEGLLTQEQYFELLKPLLDRCPPDLTANQAGRFVTSYIARARLHGVQRICIDCNTTFQPEAKKSTAKRCSQCLEERKERERKNSEDRERWAEQRKAERFAAGTLSAAGMYWHMHKIINPADHKYLASMPYRDFLKTKYWRIVRNYVLYRQGEKCQLCSETQNLNVHHRTYEHRGYEVNHLKDLIVLCRCCHQTFHDYREVN